MQSSNHLIDWYNIPSDRVQFPLGFIPHDGYYPLLAIPAMYKGTNNPYFFNADKKKVHSRVANNLWMFSTGRSFTYKKTRSWGGPFINIYSGFYSVIASSQDFDYMPSSLFDSKRKFQMRGEIDVLCLAVVKITKLPKFIISKKPKSRWSQNRKNMTLDLNLNDVTILVNEEKLRKSLFTKENYTATIRKTILNDIAAEDSRTTITVKDVSDEYLESFVISPNTVRTNSFVETITIDKEIKDGVFSNLNTEFA